MKARIVQDEFVALYYLNSSPKGKEVEQTLKSLSIPFAHIMPSHLSMTVGQFVQSKGTAAESASAQSDFEREVLLMKGLSKQRMEDLLTALRKNPSGTVSLKAVATEQNSTWKLGDLFIELAREHEVMGAYQVLYQTFAQKRSGMEEKDFTPALKQAKELLSANREIAAEEYLAAAKQLQEE